jgi:protein-S-isoprenylcysteine O-methyltransferase Ste14
VTTDRKPARRRKTEQDPWQLWFFRLVQILGVVVVLVEFYTRSDPRQIVVGTGVAFITGALGIERLVQWWTRR